VALRRVWSSIGFGDENQKPPSQPEPSASRRSPIRRRSPTRPAYIHDPQTGGLRSFRRPLRQSLATRSASLRAAIASLQSTAQNLPVPPSQSQIGYPRLYRSRPSNEDFLGNFRDAVDAAFGILGTARERSRAIQRAIGNLEPRLQGSLGLSLNAVRSRCDELATVHEQLSGQLRDLEDQVLSRERSSGSLRSDQDETQDLPFMTSLLGAFESLQDLIQTELDSAMKAVDDALNSLCDPRVATDVERHLIWEELAANMVGPNFRRRGVSPSRVDAARALREFPALQQVNARIPDGPQTGSNASPAEDTLTTPPIGSLRVPTPPMRSANTLSEAGGLGDRTRSASPDNDAGAWDTMLMTMEPDANLPSTDSSFTSAAVSASFSASATDSSSMTSSNSRGSSRTNLTIPDDSACESDDNATETQTSRPSQSNPTRNTTAETQTSQNSRSTGYEDSVNDFLRTYYRSSLSGSLTSPIQLRHQPAQGDRPPVDHWLVPANQMDDFIRQHSQSHIQAIRPIIPRSTSPLPLSYNEFPSVSSSSGLPTLTQPLNSSNIIPENLPRRRPQYRRYSHTGRSRRAQRSEDQGDPLDHPELEHMRSILQELSHSRDIPEEWWMSAGLTPTIALQQSGNNSGANSSNERERP
jgi:hypothetical protein